MEPSRDMREVAKFRSLAELPTECAQAMAIAETESFFLGQPWFQNLAEHALGADEQVHFYACLQDDVAVLATRFAESGEGVFKTRVLHSLSTFYSSLFGLAGAAAHQS